MAMSNRAGTLAVLAGAVLAVASLAGCAASAATQGPAVAATQVPAVAASGSFAWLANTRARAGGPYAVGALQRPPGWRALRGDPGSVSFAQLHAGTIVGYLNATPRSGDETIADWTTFRVAHNAQEGDRNEHQRAGVTGLRVGAARVSCVTDDYRTSRSPYRELACLVSGSRASTVLVGAAPPRDWDREWPTIERAFAAFLVS